MPVECDNERHRSPDDGTRIAILYRHMAKVTSLPPPPYQKDKRWMMFVDGENFTVRGQEIAKKKNGPFL